MNRPLMYKQPVQQQAAPKEELKTEEAKQQPVQQASSNMVEVLQNSTDPKHRNCEFLGFLKQLNTGALTIDKDSKLIEDPVKMAEWKQTEEVRKAAEIVRAEEDAKFKKEHEEYMAQLRKGDQDVDEIQDEHTEHKDLFNDIDEDLSEAQFDQMMQ